MSVVRVVLRLAVRGPGVLDPDVLDPAVLDPAVVPGNDVAGLVVSVGAAVITAGIDPDPGPKAPGAVVVRHALIDIRRGRRLVEHDVPRGRRGLVIDDLRRERGAEHHGEARQHCNQSDVVGDRPGGEHSRGNQRGHEEMSVCHAAATLLCAAGFTGPVHQRISPDFLGAARAIASS